MFRKYVLKQLTPVHTIATIQCGRLHQVEYALEAVKQGSAVIGLRSKTHAVLVALKRAPSELASYQRKMLKIDKHIGIGFAGLTSDARVLSNYMRQLSLSSRLVYARAMPLSRMISALADRAQLNTMQYGKRPYGVGFLVIGVDDTGPHLYEFSPTGNCYEYYAMSLGARNQSAKTYLERHLEEFTDVDLDELVVHGLRALRETLPQNKEMERAAVSVAIVGPGADADPNSPEVRQGQQFKLYEDQELAQWFDRMGPKERQRTAQQEEMQSDTQDTQQQSDQQAATQSTSQDAPEDSQSSHAPMDEEN